MNKVGGDMVANSWPRGQDERLEAGLAEQRANGVFNAVRGWATGAAVCPLRHSVATRLRCCRNPVFERQACLGLGFRDLSGGF